MPDMRRILIISVRAGAGHLRAAAALEAAAKSRPHLEVINCDALEYANPAFRQTFTRTYEKIASDLPSIWGMIYEKLEAQPVTSAMKKLSQLSSRVNARKLGEFVNAFAPHAVICTHYLPAEVLAPLKRNHKLDADLSIVLTDYDIHTMWIQDGADRYFVATDEMAHALRAKGIGNADVVVSGIPIMPQFAETYPDKPVIRRQLGLAEAPPTVLMAAGGFGMVPVDRAVDLLAAAIPDARFLTLAGRNEELHRALKTVAQKWPGRILPFGFVENIHQLMAAADLIVTKCGGLTSSECLAMGLPMVIIKPIPGQEERNSDFLLERGVALRANSMAHLVYKVKRLLAQPRTLARMSAAARRAAKPRAAQTILRAVTHT